MLRDLLPSYLMASRKGPKLWWAVGRGTYRTIEGLRGIFQGIQQYLSSGLSHTFVSGIAKPVEYGSIDATTREVCERGTLWSIVGRHTVQL